MSENETAPGGCTPRGPGTAQFPFPRRRTTPQACRSPRPHPPTGLAANAPTFASTKDRIEPASRPASDRSGGDAWPGRWISAARLRTPRRGRRARSGAIRAGGSNRTTSRARPAPEPPCRGPAQWVSECENLVSRRDGRAARPRRQSARTPAAPRGASRAACTAATPRPAPPGTVTDRFGLTRGLRQLGARERRR